MRSYFFKNCPQSITNMFLWLSLYEIISPLNIAHNFILICVLSVFRLKEVLILYWVKWPKMDKLKAYLLKKRRSNPFFDLLFCFKRGFFLPSSIRSPEVKMLGFWCVDIIISFMYFDSCGAFFVTWLPRHLWWMPLMQSSLSYCSLPFNF